MKYEQVQSLNEIVVTVGNSAAALLAGVLLNDVGYRLGSRPPVVRRLDCGYHPIIPFVPAGALCCSAGSGSVGMTLRVGR